jgi:hypothetical protein
MGGRVDKFFKKFGKRALAPRLKKPPSNPLQATKGSPVRRAALFV